MACCIPHNAPKDQPQPRELHPSFPEFPSMKTLHSFAHFSNGLSSLIAKNFYLCIYCSQTNLWALKMFVMRTNI